MSGPERIAENPAPYDVFTGREALVKAAQLNGRAIACIEAADDMDDKAEHEIADDLRAGAGLYAHVAQSLSSYADALTRWTTS
jgi:hypothetical protein